MHGDTNQAFNLLFWRQASYHEYFIKVVLHKGLNVTGLSILFIDYNKKHMFRN